MQRLVYNPGPIANPSTGTVIAVTLSVAAAALLGYGIYRHYTKPAPETSTGPTRVA